MEVDMKSQEGKYAWTAKSGEKGQIVIPKEAREIFEINSGDTLLILGDTNQGLAIVKPTVFNELFNEVMNSDKNEEQKD